MAEKKPCTLTINGIVYDVTNWLRYHPGGSEIIEKYNGLDATAVFTAFHSSAAIKKLSQFKGTSATTPSDKVLENFKEFREKVEKELMHTSAWYYIYKSVSTFGLLVVALVLLWGGWWLPSAVVLGLFWQQSGWLAHEYCHHQVFADRRLNDLLALVFGNLLQGFSVTWWKERHNMHHAITNVLEADPDIDNLPIFVWSEHDFERVLAWSKSHFPFLPKTIPWQAYYFLPFLTTLRWIWCLQSWLFVSGLKDSPNETYVKRANTEKALLVVHWLWSLSLLFFLPGPFSALLYFLISHCIGGFCIAVIVFFNHYACEQFPNEQKGTYNFVELQLRSTRNATPSVFLDWFAGGLNYQIEHHLFPTLPRHNLYKASLLVKEFCSANNLPYQVCGFWEGIKLVHVHLHQLGQSVTKQKGA